MEYLVEAREKLSGKRVKLRGLSQKLLNNRAIAIDMQTNLDKKLEQMGKSQTIPIADFMQSVQDNKVPLMVRRCVARVYEKMKGSPVDRMNSAVQICTWVFRTYGYTKQSGKPKTYALTSKGKNRNKWHKGRSDTPTRDNKFRTLMNKVFNPKTATKKTLNLLKDKQLERKKEMERRYKLARQMLAELEKLAGLDSKFPSKSKLKIEKPKKGGGAASVNKSAMNPSARKKLKNSKDQPKKLNINKKDRDKPKRK